MERSRCSIVGPLAGAGERRELPLAKQTEILVPIDFLEPSIRALRHARDLAAREKARLVLLNVVEEPGSFRSLDVVGQRRARYAQSEGKLQALADRELGSRVASRIEVREGTPSVEIARMASERQVDLIVVGPHHHHGFWPRLKRHTVSALSESASGPVLLLRADQLN